MSEIDEKEIKQRFEAISKFEVSPEVTARDLEQTRKSLAGKIFTKQPTELKIWRTIMKSNITKFAAAAVIIIGIMLVIYYLGAPAYGPGVAFADTIQAMKKKPWVHFKTTALESGDDILESWYGLDSGIFASRQYKEAKLLFVNTKEDTEYTYKEKEGVINYSQIDDSVRPGDYVPDSAFALVESMEDYMNKYATEITRQTIIQDNKEVELITAIAGTNEESIFNKLELTMDIGENLILSMKMDYKDVPEYMLANVPEEIREQRRNSRIDTITIFDYPTAGPNSIYDLGAPKDAEIIVSSLPEEVQKLIVKLNNLRETTLTRYVAIEVSGDSDTLPTSPEGLRSTAFFSNRDRSIYSIWKRDNSVRFSQGYFPVSENNRTIDDISENVEFWVEQIAPVREFIIKSEDGEQYRQYYLENVGTNIKSEHEMSKYHLYQADEFLIENCWPRIVVPRQKAMQWSIEYEEGRTGEKLILITRDLDTTTEKWHINPEKNYICQKHELLRSDGTSVYVKEILDYAATQSGQFYPRKIQMTRYNRKNDQQAPETATKIIYLKENPEYPDWVFDPASFPGSKQ